MKKVILEEIENMKYLLGYKRGVVISEQDNKTMSANIDSGNLGNIDPKAAEAIKVAQNMVGGTKPGVEIGGITGANAGTTPPTGTNTPPAGTTSPASTTPATPIKIGVKYPSIVELQNSLNTKYQSGLTPDGLYGPKTAAMILAALTKTSTNTPETKTPDNTVSGDANAEAIKKTAEANAPTNVTANNDANKNTQQPAGGANSVEVDGNEFA